MSIGQFVSPSGNLPELSSEELGRLLVASCDIVLVLDADGVIVDLSVGRNQLDTMDLNEWIGKSWSAVVAVDSKHKVKEQLSGSVSNCKYTRQINHTMPDGSNRIIEYQLVDFPNQTNRLAVGRDYGALERAQQQLIDVQHIMERDHHRLRQCETRYRVVLQTSDEAILVVDSRNERVIEANTAAVALLGADNHKLVGQPLSHAFDNDAREKVSTILSTAVPSTDATTLRLPGDDKHPPLSIVLSRFREGDSTQILVKLKKQTPANGNEPLYSSSSVGEICSFFDNALDALVVTDPTGNILSANSTFVDLVEMVDQDSVKGKPLLNWLGRQSVDYPVMMNHLREKEALRLYRTEIMGQYGSSAKVEISARVNHDRAGQTFGFCIRNVSNRTGAANDDLGHSGNSPSADQLAELVGRVPLKELVRESTEVIEQLSIEEALKKTGNNRASAAELLGVSRQSLYVKLRRYGIDESTASI